MKFIILCLIFLGTLMIVQGIYEDKYRRLKRELRVQYRFIPRTYYEEQMENSNIHGEMINTRGDGVGRPARYADVFDMDVHTRNSANH